MSSDKLQQAVALIKSGDKKDGQNLLIDIVNSDPKNEAAWLWLASVVSQDKRVFCLEKVLSINPNNMQAGQYLEKLKASGQIQPNSTPQTSVESKESTPIVMKQPMSSSPQYWTIPLNKLAVTVVVLENTKLITFGVQPMRVNDVVDQVNRGMITKEWYEQNIISRTRYISASLDRISRVRLLLNDVKINYRDETGKDVSTEIMCKEDKVSDALLESLQKRLGSGFVLISKPNSRWEVAGRSLITLLITFGVTGFCYWGVMDLGDTEVRGRGSGIATILQLLGPNGVLCIGGGLIILLLISIISQFVKPPMETLLVRKG